MKQIINQNIQFIEYNGKSISLIFKAILNDSDWNKPKIDAIKANYALLINPIQKNLDTYRADLETALKATPINQNSVDTIKQKIIFNEQQLATLNNQMQQELEPIRNSPPNGDKVIEENNLVWINHSKYKGAYITQKGLWVLVPSVTNLYSKGGKKLYGTDSSNPAYVVNNLNNPADSFNQIPKLDNDGYILVSQSLEPYLLYEYQNLDNIQNNPHIIFDIPKCMEDNGISSTLVDNINKVLTFDDLLGVCDNFEQASILLSFDAYNLKNDTTYNIRVNSTNNNINIENSEFLLDNFTTKKQTLSTHIKFLNQITYSIFHIYVSLYENEILIDKDVVSILVNCPKKPDPTPLPPKIKTNISII